MVKEIGKKRRRYVWWASIVIAGILVVPFPTQLAPEFTIRFVDDAGSPIQGMEVQRTCVHYTYSSFGSVCPDDWDHPKSTDNQGNISFAATYVWYGAASRVVRAAFSYVLIIAHGSVGRKVTLFPKESEDFKEGGWINIDPDNPQKEAVLIRADNIK